MQDFLDHKGEKQIKKDAFVMLSLCDTLHFVLYSWSIYFASEYHKINQIRLAVILKLFSPKT